MTVAKSVSSVQFAISLTNYFLTTIVWLLPFSIEKPMSLYLITALSAVFCFRKPNHRFPFFLSFFCTFGQGTFS